jgi:hypothetical protein
MGDARLDTAKAPDLWARRVWVPERGGPAQVHWAFAVSALVLEMIGGLGEYRGKNRPDLKSMRGTRV